MVPCLCDCRGGAADSVISISHSCNGQGLTESMRPYLSQSDSWLVIHGREKAKSVVVSKTARLLFSSNVKIK